MDSQTHAWCATCNQYERQVPRLVLFSVPRLVLRPVLCTSSRPVHLVLFSEPRLVLFVLSCVLLSEPRLVLFV